MRVASGNIFYVFKFISESLNLNVIEKYLILEHCCYYYSILLNLYSYQLINFLILLIKSLFGAKAMSVTSEKLYKGVWAEPNTKLSNR